MFFIGDAAGGEHDMQATPATPDPKRLRTPGVIAERLGVPLHRVEYVLRTRPHIQPAAVAGRLRLYLPSAMAAVRHELNAIDARRAASEGVRRA